MKKKILIGILVIGIVSLLLGVTYTLYVQKFDGSNNVSITGDIYMKYTGSDVITNNNLRPMTKSEALERDDNIFEFQIVGKNQTNRDLYYGISLENLGNIDDSDVVVYIEEVIPNQSNRVVVDGIRFTDLEKHVYVNYISKNTNSEVVKRWCNSK